MTVEDLETVLEPLITGLQNVTTIGTCVVALFGVAVGVVLMILLFRRF